MSKHSFNLSLEEEDYQALKALAEREDRHIYEQARHMLRGGLAFLKTLPRDPDSTQAEVHCGVVGCDWPGADTHNHGPHHEANAPKQEPLSG